MTKLQAIVFDMDDTLYSERDFVLSGFRAVADWSAANLGITSELSYATLFELYSQGVRNNTFDRWLMIHDIARPKLAAKFVDIYREHIPDIDPFPETIELLKLLQGAYKIGLVSDGYLAVQQAKWQALGLAEYFNAVVFSDSLGRENWKPSTAPFKLVLDKLGVEPASSVYIGDNPHKDFLGARQIGMYAIQVKRADAEYGNLEPPGLEYQPHLIVDSIADVLMAIDRL